MVSILTRSFGFENLSLAEDVVQDALLQAMRQWPFKGIPPNPSAWLMQVARNRALDMLRRQQNFRIKQDAIAEFLEHGGTSVAPAAAQFEGDPGRPIADDVRLLPSDFA